MSTTINKIKLGFTESALAEYSKMFSEFDTKNNLAYFKEPIRAKDGTLLNDNNDAKYYPEVSFSFNMLTPDEWSSIIKILNSKGFYIEYFDADLLKIVRRQMYMTTYDRSKLLSYRSEFKGAIKCKFTMVSKLGYDGYDRISNAPAGARYLND
jgi:hypothetical protein